MALALSHREDVLPIRGSFAISRGARTESRLVVVELRDGERVARGECTPYPRYGESVESVREQIEGGRHAIEGGASRLDLLGLMPAGAARNAVDCALWDLEAKRAGRRAWELAGVAMPETIVTAFTLSLDTPERMREAARAAADRPLLKLKLAGEGDLERVAAVREAAPDARLIVDANEGWRPEQVEPFSAALAGLGVDLIEQPLPAAEDALLAELAHPVPICADESCHDRATLGHVRGRYDFINIKLDKTGGLTEALLLAEAARAEGLGIMVGCMLASSLSMAPAMLIAAGARFVDLDGPLLLARDREPGIAYRGSLMPPPPEALWG
jgi:L-Ala-D/L-Glu epimerase